MPEAKITAGPRWRAICEHGYSKESEHCDGPWLEVAVIRQNPGSAHGR